MSPVTRFATRSPRHSDLGNPTVSCVTLALICLLLLVIAAFTQPDSSIASQHHHAATISRSSRSLSHRRAIIRVVFGRDGAAAVRVAICESHLNPAARNGQYMGAFQMGSRERARYGHGPGMWAQAHAALRYFRASGRDWSPWQCKP